MDSGEVTWPDRMSSVTNMHRGAHPPQAALTQLSDPGQGFVLLRKAD